VEWKWNFIPPCIPDSHPHRLTSTKCRINTVVSPDGVHSRLKHVEIDTYTKNKLCTKLALFTWLVGVPVWISETQNSVTFPYDHCSLRSVWLSYSNFLYFTAYINALLNDLSEGTIASSLQGSNAKCKHLVWIPVQGISIGF